MSELVVTGMRPYDGRYPFDVYEQAFTVREWGWIKRLTGYLPLTIDQGYEGADFELFTVFAVIALHRAGVIETKDVPDVFERFQAVAFEDTITIERNEAASEEAVDGPLPRSSNGNDTSFGDGSTTSSETSTPAPAASGTPGSATSASPLVTSGT